MTRIDRKGISNMADDGTILYSVKLSEECTVKEFIDTVLKQYPKEYGSVRIHDDGDSVFGTPLIDFKRGEITSRHPLYFQFENARIKSVISRGGWFSMHWRIEVE